MNAIEVTIIERANGRGGRNLGWAHIYQDGPGSTIIGPAVAEGLSPWDCVVDELLRAGYGTSRKALRRKKAIREAKGEKEGE